MVINAMDAPRRDAPPPRHATKPGPTPDLGVRVPSPDAKSLVPMPPGRRPTPRWPRHGEWVRAVRAERGGHSRARHDRQRM